MRTTEERLALLHDRADSLKKERDVARIRGLGGASGALVVCLVALLAFFGKSGHGITETGYAATSLLSESAGAYVLVAVVAFAVGAVLAVLYVRRQQHRC